eukprot:scaffold110123_cov57-Phaeocystis_antarctica.AAC.1
MPVGGGDVRAAVCSRLYSRRACRRAPDSDNTVSGLLYAAVSRDARCAHARSPGAQRRVVLMPPLGSGVLCGSVHIIPILAQAFPLNNCLVAARCSDPSCRTTT